MREIVFDTETTGLETSHGHRIIEIGCVELVGRIKTGKVFHQYINPERDVPQRVINIHGITEEFLSDKPLFRKIAKNFLEFVGDSPLVIHNASFDMKFINFELERASFPEINTKRAIDTLAMARIKFPGAKVSLDALCDRFGVNLSKRDKHGALLDAELLADVYVHLTGGNQYSMFGAEESKQAKNNLKPLNNRTVITERKFNVSPEEQKQHEEFIKNNVKDAMWNELLQVN